MPCGIGDKETLHDRKEVLMKHLHIVSKHMPIKGDTKMMFGKLGMPAMMLDSSHIDSMISYMQGKTGTDQQA